MTEVELSSEPLALERVIAAVEHAGAGAIATFVGTVRNTNAGRAVSLLEYEAYPPLALAVLTMATRRSPDCRIASTRTAASVSPVFALRA